MQTETANIPSNTNGHIVPLISEEKSLNFQDIFD